jgi:hypothetical protein
VESEKEWEWRCLSVIFVFYPLLLGNAGFIPNFTRLGSWNVAMFLVLEQVKVAFTPKDH